MPPERLALRRGEGGVEPQGLAAGMDQGEVVGEIARGDERAEAVDLRVREGGHAFREGVERGRAIAGGEIVPLADEAERDLGGALHEPVAAPQADQAVA